MADVKISDGVQQQVPSDGAGVKPETFSFMLKSGSVIVCGKPRSVLKLRLRHVLTKELLEDREMVSIASAFLSIQSVDSQPLWLQNPNHFEAFLNRFTSDEELDSFMKAYNELVNPVLMSAIEDALKEAESRNITKPEQIEAFVAERLAEAQREQRKAVKN